MTITSENQARINKMAALMNSNVVTPPKKEEPLYLGIDLGTANVVSLVLDSAGNPVTGVIEKAHVVREGVIVD